MKNKENLVNLFLSILYVEFLKDYNSEEKNMIQLELDNLYDPILKPDVTLSKARMLEIYYNIMHIRIFNPNTNKHPTELIPSLSMSEYDKFSSNFTTFSAQNRDDLENVILMINVAKSKEDKLKNPCDENK